MFSAKTLISLKQGKTVARLLLMTSTKINDLGRLGSLDDLERPLRTLFQITCVFEVHQENVNEDKTKLSAGKM